MLRKFLNIRIIIEGTKLSGKSTAVSILEDEIRGLTTVQFKAFHIGKTKCDRIPDIECIDRIERLIDFSLSCIPHPVLICRCHLYCLSIIQGAGLSDEWFSKVDYLLRKNQFKLILLETNQDTYFNRIEKRNKFERSVSPLDKRIEYYLKEREGLRKAFKKSKLEKYLIDTSELTRNELSNLLDKILKFKKNRSK